jgi:hypothetical protein
LCRLMLWVHVLFGGAEPQSLQALRAFPHFSMIKGGPLPLRSTHAASETCAGTDAVGPYSIIPDETKIGEPLQAPYNDIGFATCADLLLRQE